MEGWDINLGDNSDIKKISSKFIKKDLTVSEGQGKERETV